MADGQSKKHALREIAYTNHHQSSSKWLFNQSVSWRKCEDFEKQISYPGLIFSLNTF